MTTKVAAGGLLSVTIIQGSAENKWYFSFVQAVVGAKTMAFKGRKVVIHGTSTDYCLFVTDNGDIAFSIKRLFEH